MSYAAPFSLLSFHPPDRADSAEERLTWPLAGSLVIHAAVLIAFVSLRFASSLEQSSGSYEVTLVTLQEISASSTASPENTSRPERNVDKVPPPKAEAGKAPKAAPPRKAVSSPSPVPQEKSRVPELVTDSLLGALDSVVVPKLQALALPPKATPVQASAPPSVKHSPAVKMDVQPIQAPPQPPKLVIGKSERPPPAPSVAPLAQTLKQAVDSIVVPKKPKQTSRRVNPAATSDAEPIQDTTKTPESPRITLPSRAPRLATVAPPETLEKEPPLQTERKSSTMESLEQASQSVRIPESKTPQPQLPVEQEQPTVPMTTSEPDTLRSQIAKLTIPSDFDAQPVSKQTESGTEETLGLWAGSCSPQNPYWESVEEKIDKIHGQIYRYHYRVESPAILTFRVKRNGQVADLDVVRSSGNKKFDLVAKRAVLAAIPLPPFPANIPKSFCQVQHKFKVKPNR